MGLDNHDEHGGPRPRKMLHSRVSVAGYDSTIARSGTSQTCVGRVSTRNRAGIDIDIALIIQLGTAL
jgi:hypothetical protein